MSLIRDCPDLTERQVGTVINDGELASLIAQSTSTVIGARPRITAIRDHLARLLLRGKHRARVIQNSRVFDLNDQNNSINLTSSVGSLQIEYDGYAFYAKSVVGEVLFNNRQIASGARMPPSCVITFGADARGIRAFLTFDESRPEVIL